MVNNDNRGSLNALLVKHGVEYLNIDVYSSDVADWEFDEVLMRK